MVIHNFLIMSQAWCSNQMWKEESRHKAGEQGTYTERSNNFLPLTTQKCKLTEQKKGNKTKSEKNVNVSENTLVL